MTMWWIDAIHWVGFFVFSLRLFWFQVPVISWFDDPNDTELLELLPTLEAIAEADDVYTVLRSNGFTSQALETTTTIKIHQEQSCQGPIQNLTAQNNNEDR